MSCFHPIAAWRTPYGVQFKKDPRYERCDIPCGRCAGCLARRAQDWATRCVHEAQMWKVNCFVTLTYGRDKLPVGGSLDYGDFQLFMKRLRQWHARVCVRTYRYQSGVRFFMCGEYGPLNLRPHYHACLFNVDFPHKVAAGKSSAGELFYRSVVLDELWSHGNCSIQELNQSTAMYCAKYMTKKVTRHVNKGDRFVVDVDGECHTRVGEFSRCSLKPGIGAKWFERFGADVYPHDFAVVGGRKVIPPRFYDRLEKRKKFLSWDAVEFKRQSNAKARFEDSSDERLAVREVVFVAGLGNYLRSDVDG